ncbi:MAG: hypothetical protein D8B44_04275 [Actinomyces sp.]|nr:MAG: hypothetical protein D8B44_04275 [Actinomyces sp.]
MHLYPPVHRFDFAAKHWRQRSGDQWTQDRVRIFVPDAERHHPKGNFTFKADSRDLVTIDLPPIPKSWSPAVTVTIKCPTVTGATARIGIQGSIRTQTMDGTDRTWFSYDPKYLQRLTIETPEVCDGQECELHVEHELEIPGGATAATGPEAYALMAQLPDPATNDQRLGKIILGSTTLPDPNRKIGDWDTLGGIRLGQYTLPPSDADLIWVDMLDTATTVTTERGMDYDGITSAYKIGTMKAIYRDAYDPRVAKIHRGRRTVLVHIPSATPIFTGLVDTVVSHYQPDGTYTTEITSVDSTAKLAAKTSVGPLSEGWVWTSNGIGEITGPNGISWHTTLKSDNGWSRLGIHRAPYAERSLAQWLDIVTATGCRPWFIDCRGWLAFAWSPPDKLPEGMLIDAGGVTDYKNGVVYPQAIEASVDYDASSAISRLDITTDHIDQEWDPNKKKWIDKGTMSQQKTTVYERTIEQEFGERKKSVQISLNGFEGLTSQNSWQSRTVGILTKKLYYNYPSAWVSSVTLPAWHENDPAVAHWNRSHGDAMYTVNETAQIDLTDIVMVSTVQDTYPCHVTGIRWSLDTTSIKTALTLQKPIPYEHVPAWLEAIRWKGKD